MEQNVLWVKDGRYPFGTQCQKAQVKQRQTFTSAELMRQKKVEMLKKSQMVVNQSIIKMTCIVQQQKSLIYYYQLVEFSIGSYLKNKHDEQTKDIWAMTKKLILKKLAYQLTMLIGYLGKMKIQVDLCMNNLGISKDEKLKLYIGPRSKMGIKSQIQLFVVYNQAKQKIMKEVQTIINMIDTGVFSQPEAPTLQQPVNTHKDEKIKEKESFKAKFKNIPKLDTPNNHLRQTRTFQESNQYRKRKMSSGSFDLGNGDGLKFGDKPTEHKKSPKQHKMSFQHCGTQPDQPFFNYKKNTKDNDEYQEQNIGVAQSKSIKIQLQQTQNNNEKKKRKDSYKVKITTFRQYEVEGNPGDLFGVDPNAKQEDLFDYFSKKAKRQNQDEDNYEPQFNYEKRDEEDYYKERSSSDKNRKQTGQTNFTANVVPPSQPPSPVSPVWSMPEKGQTPKSPKLQQRIRQAKQRTNKALNLIKALKK